MILLDTDVLIEIERVSPAADAWLASQPDWPHVSGFAAMELYDGCQNRNDRLQVEKFLGRFTIVWPTSADMDRALRQFSRFKLSHNLSMSDALIAATAVGGGYQLATFNQRHFTGIPDLVTLQPYTR